MIATWPIDEPLETGEWYHVELHSRPGPGTGETYYRRIVRRRGQVIRDESWAEGFSGFTWNDQTKAPELPEHIRKRSRVTSSATPKSYASS